MKLTVLGYESPYPGPNGAGPGYLLEHRDKYYLIDMGSGVLSNLQQHIQLEQLEAVFLSHLHHDHISDFLVMQYAMQMQIIMKERQNPLPVYYPNEPTKEASLIPFAPYIEPIPIYNDSVVLSFDDLQVSFLRTEHSVPCYAIKFKTLDKTFVYGADSGVNTNWSPFAENADLLVLESTYLEKDKFKSPPGHLATVDIVEISNQLKPKKILLTHFYPKYDPTTIKQEIISKNPAAEIIMPKIGKVVTV